MKDQHTKISGYRDLTQEEIDLMNECKRLEAACMELYTEVEGFLESQTTVAGVRDRQVKARAFRWHSIAATDLETGFMALVRSIAQPQPAEK